MFDTIGNCTALRGVQPLAIIALPCHRKTVKPLRESLRRAAAKPVFGRCFARLALGLSLLLAGTAPAMAKAVHLPPPGCVGPASDTWLNITLDKVRSDRGIIAITVYPDDPRKFLIDGGSLYVGRVAAQPEKTRMCLFLPHPGVYALAVYHDEDNSGGLNRIGPMGIPAEGFGFSGNPNSIESLLEFRSVRLAVPRTNLSTHIRIRYP